MSTRSLFAAAVGLEPLRRSLAELVPWLRAVAEHD